MRRDGEDGPARRFGRVLRRTGVMVLLITYRLDSAGCRVHLDLRRYRLRDYVEVLAPRSLDRFKSVVLGLHGADRHTTRVAFAALARVGVPYGADRLVAGLLRTLEHELIRVRVPDRTREFIAMIGDRVSPLWRARNIQLYIITPDPHLHPLHTLGEFLVQVALRNLVHGEDVIFPEKPLARVGINLFFD